MSKEIDLSLFKTTIATIFMEMMGEHREVEATITVKIPEPMLKGIEKLAEALSVDKNELLSGLANSGIRASLRDALGTEKAESNETKTQPNPDLASIVDQLSQMENVVKQLSTLQGFISTLNGPKK